MKGYKFVPQFAIYALVGVLIFGLTSQSKAQYFQFGKNRVQYKDFDWKFIRSEHFDVYYYQDKNYGLAAFAAYNLEASLKQLNEDFDHEIADRIQVIIYDSHNDFSQTNVVPLPVDAEGIGGVTDPYKNRITMPFSGNITTFRSTLQHELEHAVLNDMFYGGNVQSRLSGNALQIPLWFNEGMAEYTSLGWDTETDMYIRDAIINDYLAPIPQLRGYYAYRGGESFWNYVSEEYGRQKITQLIRNMRNTRSLPMSIKRSFGADLEELSERWKDYYRKRYLPEVGNREDISNFADLLTERDKSGTYNTSPAISPQGDKIALITNKQGSFQVVVISAVTGEKLKTIIKGQNINFEALNILNPNLTWSPDGQKLALSTKSKGKDKLAIVDYESGNKKLLSFPKLDAVGSVAWSPDGKKIAFDGHIGTFQDIYVYNLTNKDFTNVTNDVIPDYNPSWDSDSETIYFTSSRGGETRLNEIKNATRLLLDDDIYSTDIYSVKVGDSKAKQLTKTPLWNEKQPITTKDNKLLYISDENGIPNVYEMNLEDRTTTPLTNLQTGVRQISVSADGSRLAVNSINDGYLDIFLINAPLSRKKSGSLKPNQWAKRRAKETEAERVPATGYVRDLLKNKPVSATSLTDKVASQINPNPKEAVVDTLEEKTAADADTAKTPKADSTKADKSDNVDFRNYTFDSSVEKDTTFRDKYLDESKFDVEDNKTEDGRFVPSDYRLKFSTDLVFAGGSFSSAYGTYGVTQIQFSDLLGNNQISFGTNLNLDLRNSTYFLQYNYLENRTNWIFSFFHNSSNFQDYIGRLYRIRSFGGGVNMQYPFDKFRRIDVNLSAIGLAQDYSVAFADTANNQRSAFLYPRITYTSDKTLMGPITPISGSRFAVSVSGSPPITSETSQFVSVLGDFRTYFNLGRRYSFAFRGSGAASFGRDSQTYFMGGRLGWINQQYSGQGLPLDKLGDSFFTKPALPLRGHPYNATYGNKFSLVNAEFRFPLFAALLPGPIPILPLYNLTGVAFVDAGMAWGEDVVLQTQNKSTDMEPLNDKELDFKVAKRSKRVVDTQRGPVSVPVNDGDILIGAGFGLRTVVFGFPLRYDIGWPFYRDGFKGDPINYISIGIDF